MITLTWCRHCGEDIQPIVIDHERTWITLPAPDDPTPPSTECASSWDGSHHDARRLP